LFGIRIVLINVGKFHFIKMTYETPCSRLIFWNGQFWISNRKPALLLFYVFLSLCT